MEGEVGTKFLLIFTWRMPLGMSLETHVQAVNSTILPFVEKKNNIASCPY